MIIKADKIEDKLPLLAYEQGLLISKRGDITALYEVELKEVFSLGATDYDELHQCWVRALRSLPDNTIVHKQDVFIEKKFSCKSREEGRTFLSAASDKHFNGRRYLDHRCFLYISLCPEQNLSASASSSLLNISQFMLGKTPDAKIIEDFKSSVSSFISILNENKIETRELTATEVVGDKDTYSIIEKYINLDYKDRFTLADIHVSDKEFMIGSKYVSMFSISDIEQLPTNVATSIRHSKFSSETSAFMIGTPSTICLGLGFSHIYNQYFILENPKKVLKHVEQQAKHQASFSAVSRENAINMEYNMLYVDQVTQQGLRPVRCAFNVILWDENYLQLQKKNTLTSARLANLDITANKTEYIIPQLFWAGIPGAASFYPKNMTVLTCAEQACCYINNETNYHTSKSGFGIRLCDRIGGVPLNVDISDEPLVDKHWIDNRNKFILGPSGSGKSFFTNHMVRQYYEQGTHVVIVDVGDSYLGLCKQIQQETGGKDGVYYTYKEDDPIRFNPFFVADKRYTTEKREQLSNLIFVLWKGNNPYSKTEETHVSTAINKYIDERIIPSTEIPSFNGFYEFLCDKEKGMKAYVNKEKIRIENFDIDDLCQVLKPYYKGGTYDYLLNATENIDLLDKRFIVFEIDNIKDHPTLFPVVTLVLMDTFLTKMRHPSIAKERKMILIEEAWKAISREGTAEFIKYLYKTVRKHFGEAIVVTQEVDDIIGNPIVKEAIISNADCKILLDQRKYQNKFDIVQQVLALSEKEKAIALSVNKDIHLKGRSPYKEVFITLNGNHTAVYAVEVSREEYLTYTTEKKEKVKLYELEAKYGSMQKAIEMYIKNEKS